MSHYAIGDVQGCLRALDALLAKLDFDPGRDRLRFVGDLVNRGPDSLGVLRRLRSFGSAIDCVLGNHDLHLLATAARVRDSAPDDTLQAVLDAPDAAELLDWLRRWPLLQHDTAANQVFVHAGIPPAWTLPEALREAGQVATRLRAPDWPAALREMYGDRPSAWSETLPPADRQRYTINALTRMRYCDRHGRLDFAANGPPGSQPAGLLPWFELPHQLPRGCQVIFGHWAALGVLRRAHFTALDSGCVWGGALTALDLDHGARIIQVACPAG